MRHNIILLTSALLCLCASTAIAQQTPVTEANYDLAERFSPNKIGRMVFSQTVIPSWFPNSDKFWYTWETPQGAGYWIVDPAAKSKKAVFDLDRLAMELTEIILDPFDAQHIPFMDLKLKDENTFTFSIKSTIDEPDTTSDGKPQTKKKVFRFEYDINSQELTDITDTEEKKDFPGWANIAPDSSYVVYAKGYNLYYTDMENLRKLMEDEKDSTVVEYALTTDGTKDIAYGGNDYSGVEDRDTSERYFVYLQWSPDSKKFIHQKFDMSGIGDFWVINSTAKPRPEIETYKYQMPGEPGPKSYLMLFDMQDKTSRLLDVWAFKDQTVMVSDRPRTNKDIYADYTPFVWLGDDNSFYFTRISRDEHRVDICRYWLDSDSVQVLIKERLNTYIDVCDFELLSSGEIVMRSERNGWAQLYLHDKDGKLLRPLTDGAYHVSTIEGVDEKAGKVYFTATGYDKDENPYYNHLLSVGLDGEGVRMLNPGNFDNRSWMPDDLRYFVNNASRVDTAPANALYNAAGKKIMDLETADLSQLFAAGYKFPEIFKVKAADGITDLWGVMYKPFDFDSTKLYPIIEYVYPGPQIEATEYFWTSKMNRIDRLAQVGFIVITVGQRGGHPDRSKWYHNFGYGNMRDYPLADHKYAVQQLAARHKYIDINKVGIHGHSGGGFMSTAAILTYPDFYKAAVSCAGNHDNRIYNRWWSETHHGVKEVISEDGDTTFNYSIEANQDFVRNLKGHLLLVHGDMDNNVHPANTTRVVDALIRANKRFEMLYLPGQRHGFGDMDEYFFWKMTDFFSRWLIGDCEDSVDIRQMNND
ncbi:MAG TPA: DPP IV N-terminal domain-containing protein [Candidatus Coprenecus pullistercoris]|nr:DPP IV N-terminal domain-containing protein [Candidatus Coprenecus pullistercoris]